MSKMNEAVFTQLEEIGFRIKATRAKHRLRASAVSQGGEFIRMHSYIAEAPIMTSSSYTNIEKGKGSIITLAQGLDLIGLRCEVQVKYTTQNKNQSPITTTFSIDDITELQNITKKIRQEKGISISELSKKAQTTYSSIVVFEKTERPTIYSLSKYLETMEVQLEITLTDIRDNTPINPSKDMPIIRYEKLVEEFQEFMDNKNRDEKIASESSTDSKKDFMQEIGNELKEMRLNQNMSRLKLARLINSSEIMIMQVESGKSSLESSNLVASAFGKRINIYMSGKKIKDILSKSENEIKTQRIEVSELTQILDDLRIASGFTVSDFAKVIGTTYRSVDVFRTVVPHKKSLMRYIDGLGIKVQAKLLLNK